MNYFTKSSDDLLKERIELALVEEINKNAAALQEPEKFLPAFVEMVTLRMMEITKDELHYRRFK